MANKKQTKKKATPKKKAQPKKKDVELQTVAEKPSEVAGFIQQAIQQNLPVETMERLFALKEKHDANVARDEFVKAMSAFQADCPVIEKKKAVKNKGGSLRYKYAPLDDIVAQVKETLGKHGLSYKIETKNEEGMVTSICKVTHVFGHTEVSEFAVPIDKEGYMSAPQKYASASTFSKRYAFCNALGILTGDEDDDNVTQVEADKQKGNAKFEKIGVDKGKLKKIEQMVNGSSDVNALKAYPAKIDDKALRAEAQKLVDKRIKALEKDGKK